MAKNEFHYMTMLRKACWLEIEKTYNKKSVIIIQTCTKSVNFINWMKISLLLWNFKLNEKYSVYLSAHCFVNLTVFPDFEFSLKLCLASFKRHFGCTSLFHAKFIFKLDTTDHQAKWLLRLIKLSL